MSPIDSTTFNSLRKEVYERGIDNTPAAIARLIRETVPGISDLDVLDTMRALVKPLGVTLHTSNAHHVARTRGVSSLWEEEMIWDVFAHLTGAEAGRFIHCFFTEGHLSKALLGIRAYVRGDADAELLIEDKASAVTSLTVTSNDIPILTLEGLTSELERSEQFAKLRETLKDKASSRHDCAGWCTVHAHYWCSSQGPRRTRSQSHGSL